MYSNVDKSEENPTKWNETNTEDKYHITSFTYVISKLALIEPDTRTLVVREQCGWEKLEDNGEGLER